MGGGASEAQPIQPQPQAPSNPPEQPPVNKNDKDKKSPKKDGKKVRQKCPIKKSQKNTDSRQQDSQPDQPKPKQILFKAAPKCINNKPSTHLCLSKKCTEYPFFCMNCEGSCNEVHIHNHKQASANLKEFESRIQGRIQIDENLKQSLQNYKQTLLDLKVTFQEFYQNQSETIRQVEFKKEPSPKAIMLRRRIEKGDKKGLSGQQISELWNEQKDKWMEEEQKWITLLNQKEESLISMCECFLNINNIQIQTQQPKTIQRLQSPPPIQKKQQKAWHIFKRYQFDKDKLSLSKENCWSNAKKQIFQDN